MRPRERYTTLGPAGLADSELLALAIGLGLPNRPAPLIARDLLARFGDLRSLAGAPVGALATVSGIGPARAARLHASLQAGLRAARAPQWAPPTIDSPEAAARWLTPRFAGWQTERLVGMYLDRKQRVLALEELSRGSDTHTIVEPRSVFRPAVQCGAAHVIVAHNHPSGDPTPSHQDRQVTTRLAQAGRVLGIPLLDHLVIAGELHTSLSEVGLLQSQSWPVPTT